MRERPAAGWLERLRRAAWRAHQRSLTLEPVVLITLLGALLMALLGIGELLGLNPPAAGTASLVVDLLFALLLGLLGLWMLRRPARMAPRWLMIALVSMGFGLALFTVKLPGVMVFLLSLPVLIAILATGRLYPLVGYPLILALALAANPVARQVISPLMVVLELLLFLIVWHLLARAGAAARQQAQAEAQLRQEQATRELVSFFAHEIKAYATGLAGLAPLISPLVAESSAGQARGQRLLAGFNDVVGQTNLLMEQLLLLGREGVLQRLHCVELPLRPLLERLLLELELQAQGLDIRLEPSLELPEGCAVRAQPLYLGLALGSTLRNALEAAAQAGQRQLVLRISVQLQARELAIRVEDTGPGLPPELLAALRKPGRLLPGWSSKPGGGLGLPLLLQVARLHQGRVLAGNAGAAGHAWVELWLPLG